MNNINILNKKFLKKNKSAFTLVELIIVVTILGILATIAFISFQSYSKNARDGNRITTMKNISKGLEIYKIQTGNYPKPDNSFNVEASGTLIGYQGIIGDTISRNIKINITPKDPFDSSNYLYSVNSDNSKYQLLGYLETPDYLSLLNQSYAIDYSSRYIKTLGDKVGVILDTNKSPISGITKVDVATGTTVYNVYFSDNDSVNGSGNTIFSNMYTRRSDLQNNKNIANYDSSLVGYWDMETMSGGKLRDLSKYGNDAAANSPNIVDGKIGKAILFTPTYQINAVNFNSIAPQKEISISFWVKLNSINVCNMITLNPFNGTGNDRMNIHFPWYGTYPGNIYWQFATDGTTISAGTQFPTPVDNLIGNWNYFVFETSMSGGYSRIYMNGVLKSSGLASGIHNNFAADLVMGNIDGILDEVHIYNRALSDTEIQSFYNSTK